VSKGIFSSYEEAIAAMSHVTDTFEPNKADHAIYEELYSRIFEKMFKKLSPLYQEIGSILG
jgi:sugar (pentulose or hexulose) kinase